MFLGIHIKININRKVIEIRIEKDIPQLWISVDSFLMPSYLQSEVLSTLKETSTFSNSHGLTVEISSEEDTSTIAATFREHFINTLPKYGKM